VISRSSIAQLGVGQLPRGSPGGIDDVHGFEASSGSTQRLTSQVAIYIGYIWLYDLKKDIPEQMFAYIVRIVFIYMIHDSFSQRFIV
jgi:hypothetical protein